VDKTLFRFKYYTNTNDLVHFLLVRVDDAVRLRVGDASEHVARAHLLIVQ
jgi:hypothetical protein